MQDHRKMVSIQLISSAGTLVDDKIIVSSESNPEVENVKSQLKEKLASLDVHRRKQLLMELLTSELNEIVTL